MAKIQKGKKGYIVKPDNLEEEQALEILYKELEECMQKSDQVLVCFDNVKVIITPVIHQAELWKKNIEEYHKIKNMPDVIRKFTKKVVLN